MVADYQGDGDESGVNRNGRCEREQVQSHTTYGRCSSESCRLDAATRSADPGQMRTWVRFSSNRAADIPEDLLVGA